MNAVKDLLKSGKTVILLAGWREESRVQISSEAVVGQPAHAEPAMR